MIHWFHLFVLGFSEFAGEWKSVKLMFFRFANTQLFCFYCIRSFFSLAYGLNAAVLLDNTNAGKFFIRIEDFIRQADEVDGKYLHVSSITLLIEF